MGIYIKTFITLTPGDQRLSATDMSFMRQEDLCMPANMQWFYSMYMMTRTCMNMIFFFVQA